MLYVFGFIAAVLAIIALELWIAWAIGHLIHRADDAGRVLPLPGRKTLQPCVECHDQPAMAGTWLCHSCGKQFEHDLEALLERRRAR